MKNIYKIVYYNSVLLFDTLKSTIIIFTMVEEKCTPNIFYKLSVLKNQSLTGNIRAVDFT